MKTIDPHMHTAEHILNQTVVRFLGCERCFSAHIEKKKSKCDYRVGHAPHPDQIRAIESQVNRVIREGLKVRATELEQLREALSDVQAAKDRLRDRAREVFGGE